jgi:hypothetical protein
MHERERARQLLCLGDMGVNRFVSQFFDEIAAPVPLQALREERIEHGLEGRIGHFAHPVEERRGQLTKQLGHDRLAIFRWTIVAGDDGAGALALMFCGERV